MGWTSQFSDTFTDTNGTSLPSHDGTWVNDESTLEIQSNSVAAASSAFARSHITTSLADIQACEWLQLDDGNYFGGGVRYTSQGGSGDNFDGYMLFWNTNTLYLYRRDNGSPATWSLLDSAAETHDGTEVARIEASGSSITGLVDTVSRVSGTDATYSSGSAAIRGSETTPFLDTFVAYDDAGAAAAIMSQMQHSNLGADLFDGTLI